MSEKMWKYLRKMQRKAVDAIRTQTGDLRHFDRMIKNVLMAK